MQLCQNNSVFASQEKNKEQIITCGISKQPYVGLQPSQLSLAYLHQDGDPKWRLTTDWTLVLLGYLGGGLGSYGIEMPP